jgi:hypothetical protein
MRSICRQRVPTREGGAVGERVWRGASTRTRDVFHDTTTHRYFINAMQCRADLFNSALEAREVDISI